MGTGSHRPQFEAAKGRADELGGIQHARSLKSHAKLKYRDKPLAPERKTPERRTIESGPAEPAKQSDQQSSSDSEDDLESMQKELDLLKQRNALRSQKEDKQRPPAKWRTETAFKKKKNQPKTDDLVKRFVR